MTPTPEQQAIMQAVTTTDKSLMINAYAGTGKTTTLEMISKALPRKSSLAIAFNVKIKKELERRFPDHFTVMTFNGLGHRAWARTIRGNITLDDKKLGKIITDELKKAGMEDRDEAWPTVRELVTKAMARGLTPKDTRKGWLDDTDQNWKDIAEDNWLEVDEALIEVARRTLHVNVMKGHEGTISFDDQLYLPIFFGGQFPRFDIVLVDEAQDLSPLNHEQVKRVSGVGRLIVCGDSKQAIYAFRGADSSSMGKIRALRNEWIDLPLVTTFRCPKVIVNRQLHHAIGFKAFETAPEGEFKRLQSNVKLLLPPDYDSMEEYEDALAAGTVNSIVKVKDEDFSWDVKSLPQGEIAILCRNNAPLLSIAFKIIKQGIGVQMLGRDIGKGLISLVTKLASSDAMDVKEFRERLEDWYMKEHSKALMNDDDKKADGVQDRYECLVATLDNTEVTNVRGLKQRLVKLFEDGNGNRITLATGHRSKGLEWSTVVHLDPWRLPSKFARKNPSQMEQEKNLLYVIETRTKSCLIEANLEEFGE